MESMNPNRYDIAVIGTGPAGLSAAITAKLRGKRVLLLGSRLMSTKLTKAHLIQNYLGLPSVSGEQLAEAFQSHLDAMELSITDERVAAIYDMGGYFSLQAGEQFLEAGAVILATGVTSGKALPGEKEFLGRGVSYCATCDAPLYRGKTVIVVGYSQKEESEAVYLAEVVSSVLYLPMYRELGRLADESSRPANLTVLREIPQEILGERKVSALRTSGQIVEADGIFVLRESIAPEQLVPGLLLEQQHVAVNRLMETNLPGCFACGDLVGAPYQYIKAAGEGNIAALSAVSYLDSLQKK
ncbi:MAG: NAD(P)/FAD-dependent oxidoreductase [Eubacteriales bacterium]|nr:NAD(P)/FAD-dependent oxidoreductase [Eubacteriales bacterium]